MFFHAVSSTDIHATSVATACVTVYSLQSTVYSQNVRHFLSSELQSVHSLGILRSSLLQLS
jgi:hypothetical protein